jgi:hypothetical protein
VTRKQGNETKETCERRVKEKRKNKVKDLEEGMEENKDEI